MADHGILGFGVNGVRGVGVRTPAFLDTHEGGRHKIQKRGDLSMVGVDLGVSVFGHRVGELGFVGSWK